MKKKICCRFSTFARLGRLHIFVVTSVICVTLTALFAAQLSICRYLLPAWYCGDCWISRHTGLTRSQRSGWRLVLTTCWSRRKMRLFQSMCVDQSHKVRRDCMSGLWEFFLLMHLELWQGTLWRPDVSIFILWTTGIHASTHCSSIGKRLVSSLPACLRVCVCYSLSAWVRRALDSVNCGGRQWCLHIGSGLPLKAKMFALD